MQESSKTPENAEKSTASQEGSSSNSDFSFHPLMLTSKDVPKVLTDDEAELSEKEKHLEQVLQNMGQETAELSKLLDEESKLVKELQDCLKQIMEKIHVSVTIVPPSIPSQGLKEITLNQNGELTTINDNGEKHTAPLSAYPPEMIMSILFTVIPETVNVITSLRRKIGNRINLFEKMRRELKNAARAMLESVEGRTGEQKRSAENPPTI